LGPGLRYFWPGVPAHDLAAVTFFEHRGWVWDHEVADLVGNIAKLNALPLRPQDVAVQITTLQARPDLADSLVLFAERDFPQWAAHYAAADPSWILLAIDAAGVVGAAILTPPDSLANPVRWAARLGPQTGALGAVGVAPTAEGRGIGSQLVLAGADRLRERGATRCYLGWVWRTSFYERLGFWVWCQYRVAALRAEPG
jgi:GNAT superfamily N-acetyltransferase